MPLGWTLVLAAVAAGWFVQLLLAHRQAVAFTDALKPMRASGTVAIGRAGKRYRGGRAYVAVALDDHDIVRDAVCLRGFTTFARPKPVPGLIDVKANRVLGDHDLPRVPARQREAARMAVTLARARPREPDPAPQVS